MFLILLFGRNPAKGGVGLSAFIFLLVPLKKDNRFNPLRGFTIWQVFVCRIKNWSRI